MVDSSSRVGALVTAYVTCVNRHHDHDEPVTPVTYLGLRVRFSASLPKVCANPTVCKPI